MRVLTIVRHAKSSWRFGELDDFRRPLNARGLRDCRRMAKALTERIDSPDHVISSDAVRAIQTCETLAEAFDLGDSTIELNHDMYLASREELVALVRACANHIEHLAVVGHNPGLTDLYNYFVEEPLDNLPTFGVASIEFDATEWPAVAEGDGRVRAYFTPKEL